MHEGRRTPFARVYLLRMFAIPKCDALESDASVSDKILLLHNLSVDIHVSHTID